MSKHKIITICIALIVVMGLIAIPVTVINSKKHGSEVKGVSAIQVDRGFVEHLFNYNYTDERYDGIKDYMTDEGYLALFPSGREVPNNLELSSSTKNLKIFIEEESISNEENVEILNQFDVTTEYGGIDNTENVIMRTVLILQDGQWKIDDLQMIIQNSNY